MHITTTHNNFSDLTEAEAYIAEREAIEGGAWGYSHVFGEVYITRADVPSKLPDTLISDTGSPRRLYFRGEWSTFSKAAVIREGQRGLLAD